MVLTDSGHWSENNKRAWRELINAAKNGNMAKFRNLYNKGSFNSWGIGGLGGAWAQAKENAGINTVPKPPKIPKNLNDFKIGNRMYKLGNSVYIKLIPRHNAPKGSNFFVKRNNKTTFYQFHSLTDNWRGSHPPAFHKIATANRPQIVNGNTGYRSGHGGQYYKVVRYANGYNFWVPAPANK
jgi:hypothetical protein